MFYAIIIGNLVTCYYHIAGYFRDFRGNHGLPLDIEIPLYCRGIVI